MLARRGLVLLARAGRRDFSAAATTGLPGSGVFDFLGAETASAPATTLMTGSAGSDVWRTAVEAQFGGSVGETWGAPIGADGEGESLLESLFDPIALIKRTFQPSFLRRKRVSPVREATLLCIFLQSSGAGERTTAPPMFQCPPTTDIFSLALPEGGGRYYLAASQRVSPFGSL